MIVLTGLMGLLDSNTAGQLEFRAYPWGALLRNVLRDPILRRVFE
jgi:hypothetical protein